MSTSKDNVPFVVRSKIWIADHDEQIVFGLGRYRILEAVHRLGSLQAAAQELKMSYRAVWCRLKTTEERLHRDLLVRSNTGSTLTPFALQLLKQFRRLQAVIEAESDAMFKELMADSIVPDQEDADR
ncbi:winged helix-turn-helix domain-containing protein [Desulfovermiculus halophilus]|uniref:winged helix-turn-helix domain-containing protein n=1 Tax=Desulfovermiculus halophilus TaxID=339722 RepID=UPI0004804778|nr:LysR family transcriptional regulator [Desulfovermiculus halophilus]